MKRTSIILIVLLSLPGVCYGQQQTGAPDVYVESWKAGRKILEQEFNFKLGASSGEQARVMRDVGVGEYKLTLRHYPPARQFELDYWDVDLREVLSEGRGKKKYLGESLIHPGGGDYFPKEDWIGTLYPKEEPTTVAEKLTHNFYPISARRVIKVQNFYMIIKVNNYKLSESNPKKLDSMDVTIKFTNTYKNCGAH